MKKFVTGFFVLVLAAMVPLFLMGCAREVQGNAHFISLWRLWNVPDFHDPEVPSYMDSGPRLFSSRSEIEELFSETYSMSWCEKQGKMVRDNKFANIITRFDDEFFKENQVVMAVISASGGGVRFELSRVEYQNGALWIEINHIQYSGGHAAIEQHFASIEICLSLKH